MKKIDLGGNVRHVHFIGIGGISMSGLAEMLRLDGYQVSGSDAAATDITRRLAASGIPVAIGNAAENIQDGMDLIVFTAAVKADNPEYAEARRRGIPLMNRAALLGLIMEGYEKTVCVSGTHGKTSTTSLIAEMLLHARQDPTIAIGGHMGEGYNFRIGQSPYFVMEACEYFDSFLQWKPQIGIILNIDYDHMDYFGSLERLTASFAQYARNIKPGGTLVVCAETRGLPELLNGLNRNVITYGLRPNAADSAASHFDARNITYDEKAAPIFDIYYNGAYFTRAHLSVTGEHQVLNALAAAAAGHTLGLSAGDIGRGLSAARGVKRRFEHKGEYRGAEVVDDYAHHPTEIEANLNAAKKRCKNGRIICAFQSHTYTRTRNLLHELSAALSIADITLLLPIYAAREPDPGDISARDIQRIMRENGAAALYMDNFDEAVLWLTKNLMPSDLLITMGAGDVFKVGETLLRT